MDKPTKNEINNNIKRYTNPGLYKKRYPEFYNFLMDSFPFAKKLSEALYCFYNGLKEPPLCPVCGHPVNYINWKRGYHTYCGIKCQSNATRYQAGQTMLRRYGGIGMGSEVTRGKINKTNLEKYGTVTPAKNKDIKEKTKQTNLKKYGNACPLQNKDIHDKAAQTMMGRYGVEHPLQIKDALEKQIESIKKTYNTGIPQEKAKQTNLKKYGNVCPLQNKDIHDKAIQTMMDRYGVEHPLQNKDIHDKATQTMMDRYGVEHAIQNLEINKKQRESLKNTYSTGKPQLKLKKAWAGGGPKRKYIQTSMVRYGVPYYTQTNECKGKYKQTCIERYGVEYVGQSEVVKDKARKTQLEHFGVPNKMVDMCSRGEIKYQGYSNISQECFHRLDDILKLPSYYATKNQEFRVVVGDKNYYLDYYVPALNLAVEFNGDWFHFNPSKYKADDVVEQFNHPVLVKERWEQDANRIKAIESTGIKVLVLWESEYKKLKNIKKWLYKILHDNMILRDG